MLKINNKPILTLCYKPNIADKSCLLKVWNKFPVYIDLYGILSSQSSINTKINSINNSLSSPCKLYFGKTSKFPRFKLQDTSFKRCIKPEKADTVVVGCIEVSRTFDLTLYQDEEYIYAIDSNNLNRAWGTTKDNINAFIKNPAQYIRDNNLFYGAEFKFLYEGPVCAFTFNTYTDVMNIMNNVYTNIINDETLDKEINQGFESITEEDLNSILDMLDSSDLSTVDIGLKMLCGYNVNELPLTINFILSMRPSLSSTSAWKSVGVKQVLSSIKFTSGSSSVTNYWFNETEFNNTTQLDRELFKKYYVKEVKKSINDTLSYSIKSGLNKLGLTFKYDIE